MLVAFQELKIELLSGYFGLDSVCYSNKMDIQFSVRDIKGHYVFYDKPKISAFFFDRLL